MKTKTLTLSLFLLFSLAFTAFAQQPEATPPVVEENDSLKISTTLIQIDVTVTDKDDKVVTDLRPEDFEVYENGKKQEITNLSFISVNPQTNRLEVTAQRKKSKNQPSIPIPPVKLKEEQVRRTYAIVVDDLGISFQNIYWVQQDLKKFINEQMQDGDLVAIIRTGVGIGALQSFTSDKRQLLAAVDKIRWNPRGRGGSGTFAPIQDDTNSPAEEARRNNFSNGTLGALNYVIGGMRDLPGRKSLLLISEGFVITDSKNSPNQVLDNMRVLADLANRSSVVLYTIDPRGLDNPGMYSAQDIVTDISPGGSAPGLAAREKNFYESQRSLQYLAYETGGFPFVNQNNAGKGLLKAVNDQSSYYLVGYQPDAETFDAKKSKFNKLEVKVLRPGLKVRYRSGFFNYADKKEQPAPQNASPKQNASQKLVSALVSPFGASGINLDLYSLFYNDDRDRSFIHSLVYIDPADLTFTMAGDGLYHAKFDVIAAVFDTNGMSANNGVVTQELKFTSEQLAKIKKNGIVYDLPVPIVKTGGYQFRIALRDAATGKIGAVSQYIEVPDLKKNKLTLSNFMLDNFTAEEWKNFTNRKYSGNALLNSTVRRYRRGTTLRYSYIIYNAKLDRTQKPQLEIQTRLIRDGKVVLESPPTPFDADGQTDLERLQTAGTITLGNELAPGTYILQVIAFDRANGETKRFGTQFVEFEIIK